MSIKVAWRAVLALLMLLAGASHAQNYPQRSVRLIVPFAAGGTTDTLGRFLAQPLTERLGQQVVVENRAGGGGIVGSEVAARAQPDGYALLLGSAESFGMTYDIAKRLGYNPERDLVPVTMIARAPNAFVVHPSLKAYTLKDLIALARAHPGKLHFGSPGVGSNPHLIGELFKNRFKLDMVHVPYKGGGASIIDLMSGQIETLVTGLATVAPRHTAGRARALAMTGNARSPLLPEVPTMAEAGVNDFVLGALFGVFVPSGTPPEVIARLGRELGAITQAPDFRKRLAEIGQETTEPLAGAAFGRYMLGEVKRWRELAELAGVREQ